MHNTTTDGGAHPTSPQGSTSVSLNQIGMASFIGTTMEWYDFFVYSTAAALVFGSIFFPAEDPLVGTILAFSTLAAGYFARPLGAVLIGHFGDKFGRKRVLVGTLLAMGIATVLMGLLPTYETIGVAAPILLVALRIVQGLAVGGEWSGAVLIAAENAPPHRRTFYASFAQMGSPAGLLLATVVFTVLQIIVPDDALISWAWRIPFLLAAVLVPIGLIIRLRIDDAPEFKEAARREKAGTVPLVKILVHHWRGLIIGTGAFLGVFAIYYLLTTFVLTYATNTLGMSADVVLPANIVSAVAEGIGIAAGVWLASRLRPRIVTSVSAVILALWSVPAFWLMHFAQPLPLYFAVGVAMFFVGTSYGVLAGEVAKLFSATARYTGIGLNYHLSGALGGGLAPVAATWMLAASGGVSGVVILCLVVGAFMTVSCLLIPVHPVPELESDGSRSV